MSDKSQVVLVLGHNVEGRKGYSGQLTVNGVDLSNIVSEVIIKAPARELPQVTLVLSPAALRVELPAEIKAQLFGNEPVGNEPGGDDHE